MNVDDIYTPIGEAREEIKRRWNDLVLKKKVEEFLGYDYLPDYFFQQPHAISIEDVATPNLYCWTFIARAHKAGLEPLHFEYLDDIFVTTNHDKASIAKMHFYHGLDDHGNMIGSVHRVINLDGSEEKKKIRDIKTLTGDSLADFHHKLLLKNFPDAKIFDGTEWFKSKGGNARNYYTYVLAMAVCHGVLFENFLNYDYEAKLVSDILMPAFEEVERMFGYRPLIVSVAPTHEHLAKQWLAYPEFIKTMIHKSSGVDKFEIRDTLKYGKGVYATNLIHKGEVIREFTGKSLDEKTTDKMIEDGLLNNDNPLQVGRDEYYILDEISIAFNHSCDPNALMSGKSTLIAIDDIMPGQEITYDYSTTVPSYNHTFTTMTNCLCGKSRCRKILGNVMTIPREIIEEYIRKGGVQDFVRESLSEV